MKEDMKLPAELQSSEKERAELTMIVDLGAGNDFGHASANTARSA